MQQSRGQGGSVKQGHVPALSDEVARISQEPLCRVGRRLKGTQSVHEMTHVGPEPNISPTNVMSRLGSASQYEDAKSASAIKTNHFSKACLSECEGKELRSRGISDGM